MTTALKTKSAPRKADIFKVIFFIIFCCCFPIKYSSLQATDMSKVVSPEREPPIKNNNEDSAEENEVN